MPKLGMERDFAVREFPNLEKKVRERTADTLLKFADTAYTGAHLEKVSKARDPRFRSVRIDRSYRGIVLAPEGDDCYMLLTVLPHDKAYEWARRHEVSVNEALGRIEIGDIAAIEETLPAIEQIQPIGQRGLFDHVTDDVFDRFGIDPQVRTVACAFTAEVQLEAARGFLPNVQWAALYGLAAGLDPDDVWAELGGPIDGERFDADDLTAAIERSPDRMLVVDGPDELLELFRKPFDLWRVYLHPAQYEVAHGDFAGPARVTGGPGTGKTVVAMHRAKHLAERGEGTVLLTTFTRTLAASLEAGMNLLVDSPDVRDRIDIRHIDQVAHEAFRARHGKPRIATDDDLAGVCAEVLQRHELPITATFLLEEWRQVVLAQDVRSADQYLKVRRHGRGKPLLRAQRRPVWAALEDFARTLVARRLWTYETVCATAVDVLQDAQDKPYRHVIVDEAQDLSPTRWRMLRALTQRAPNDVFIAGDTHQRIYDHRVSLSEVGVEVRGRSSRLNVNYRTTAEILGWSLGILRGERIDDMDGSIESIAGCRCEVHGYPPTLRGARDLGDECDHLAEQIRQWGDGGIGLGDIAVAARSNKMVERVADALTTEDVPAFALGKAKPSAAAVSVGTMHRMKGLEFRCLAVVGVSDGLVPASATVTSRVEDEATHRHDLQRERCLLFVACTRAREQLYVSWHGAPSPFLGAAAMD